MRQEVQTAPLCLGVSGLVPCVENRRWTVGGVTYATLNIQGSCNNLCDTAPDPAEYARAQPGQHRVDAGDLRRGQRRHSAAVMLIAQANPGWDLTDPTRAPLRDPKTLAETDGQPDGFQDFLVALRDEVIAFRRPVAYVHGDSHYFRVDKPFLDAQGRRLENFTRVETFGDNAGERQQRRALAEGHRQPAQPRGVLLPAADRPGQPHGGSGAVRPGIVSPADGAATVPAGPPKEAA